MKKWLNLLRKKKLSSGEYRVCVHAVYFGMFFSQTQYISCIVIKSIERFEGIGIKEVRFSPVFG